MDLHSLIFHVFSLTNKCKFVLVLKKLSYFTNLHSTSSVASPPSHGSPTLVHNHNGEPRNDIGRDG